MDYDKLIEHLRECGTYGFKQEECRAAATALSTLQAEQRLIDANKILYHQAWESGSMEPANEGVALMSEVQAMPTIDPEALPIVRQLREELERVTAERDAAIKELDEVTSEVDDLAEFVDREIHPVVDYNLYLDLRENVDAVSMFQHEDEWRGPQKED